MNRPDLDAIEAADRRIGNIRNGDLEEVIAYARHLERQLADEVEYINTQNEGYAKLLTQAQVYARHLEARISELEMARTVLPGEVFDQILNDISEGEIEALNRRISELETALEPFAQAYAAMTPELPPDIHPEDWDNAARVLRKGE